MRDLVFFSPTFGGSTNGDCVIGHFPKSYRAGEYSNYGLRLTKRPAACDKTPGIPSAPPLGILGVLQSKYLSTGDMIAGDLRLELTLADAKTVVVAVGSLPKYTVSDVELML